MIFVLDNAAQNMKKANFLVVDGPALPHGTFKAVS